MHQSITVPHLDDNAGTLGGSCRAGDVPGTSSPPLANATAWIRRHANPAYDVTYSDWRPGDQKVYVSDISKAKADFGREPRVAPAEGLRRMWEWIVANRKLDA